MKYTKISLLVVTLLLIHACKAQKEASKESNIPTIDAPYLGQKPPGLVPEPFAPGMVVKKGWEYGGSFSPDQKEFYFLREVAGSDKHEFVMFSYKDNKWQESIISRRVGQPFIAPDGQTMHLGRRYKERLASGEWSEIKRLGGAFDELKIMRLTASHNNTYVFDEVGMPLGDGSIRYSRLIDGKREKPTAFGKEINTGKFNAHPFIAPDESYIIWDGERESGYGESDIYISFKQKDATWGPAINLGDQINTSAWEAAATVSPDGKYLFFNRNVGSDNYENVDIFWVDAKIIEELKINTRLGNRQVPEYKKTIPTQIDYYFEKDIPHLEKAFIDTKPVNRNDGILVGELGVDGGSKEQVVALAEEIAGEKHGAYDSMLIVGDAKLLFESYYLRGRANLPHSQASVTKAYLGLVIGRAIEMGYLSSSDLHKPVVDFLQKPSDIKFAQGAENITLHQVMTMRSGIRIGPEKGRLIRKNSTRKKGTNYTHEYLKQSSPITKASQTFKYQNVDARIAMQVLENVVPGSAIEFIKNEFFNKLGITSFSWPKDVNGVPLGDSGSNLTSRDMLKIGALIVQKGMWKGEQLISKDFLEKATHKITKPTEEWIPTSYTYGYFWYQSTCTVKEKTYQLKFAWGGGGQYIIVVEELGLVVAITGHDFNDTIMKQVKEKIIPAFATK